MVGACQPCPRPRVTRWRPRPSFARPAPPGAGREWSSRSGGWPSPCGRSGWWRSYGLPSGLSDPFLYHGYGLRIAAGRGYRSLVEDLTAYYPPGYPYLLGGLYKLADIVGLDDHLDLVVGLTQSLLWAVAAMAVVLTGRWAFGSRSGPTVGIAAGLIVACWPNLVTYAGAWLSESLFVALFAVAVAALTFAAAQTPMTPPAQTPEVRPATGPWSWPRCPSVPPRWCGPRSSSGSRWLPPPGWWEVSVGGGQLALAAAVSVGVAVFVVPWAVRNDRVFGEPVLVSTNGGDNLCIGFHPGARGSFHYLPDYCNTGEFWNDGREAELRRNDDTRELALEFIRDEPLALPWLSVRKLFYTYRSDDDGLVANESYGDGGGPRRLRGGGSGSRCPTWPTAPSWLAAVVGLVVAARRCWSGRGNAAQLALLGLTAAGIVVPVLFFGDPRFKVPSTPLFAIFAGLGVATVLTRWRERTT